MILRLFQICGIDNDNFANFRHADFGLIHRAAHTSFLPRYIELGADVNMRDSGNNTPLHYAAFNGQVLSCSILIEHGTDISAQNDSSETPLDAAKFKLAEINKEAQEEEIENIKEINKIKKKR